jgi:hypothetical protein
VYYKKMNPTEYEALPGSLNLPTLGGQEQLEEDYISPPPAVNLPSQSENK